MAVNLILSKGVNSLEADFSADMTHASPELGSYLDCLTIRLAAASLVQTNWIAQGGQCAAHKQKVHSYVLQVSVAIHICLLIKTMEESRITGEAQYPTPIFSLSHAIAHWSYCRMPAGLCLSCRTETSSPTFNPSFFPSSLSIVKPSVLSLRYRKLCP